MTTTAVDTALTVDPFQVHIDDTDLDDLHERLARTRLARRAEGIEGPATDVDPGYVERLLNRWRDGFDWRAVEAKMNELPQVLAEVDGRLVHAVHARAAEPTGLPVMLLHGWPDTFWRYADVVPRMLAAGHDVVVPSLPGSGFSDQPAHATMEELAETLHTLVTGLGYESYAVGGGDWGAGIADAIATAHPNAVAALHLTDVPFSRAFGIDLESTEGAEREFLTAGSQWADQAAYFTVAGAQPMALSYGLLDSPVGLLAWLGEKYARWADTEPDLDAVLAQVSLVWFTRTAYSAMRLYSEFAGDDDWSEDADWSGEDAAARVGSRTDEEGSDAWGVEPLGVPTAFLLFPADIGVPPREHAERFFDVRRFTLMPRGGHFGAMEHPAEYTDDLVAFLSDL